MRLLFIFIPAFIVKRDANRIRKEKLEEVRGERAGTEE